MTKPKLVPDPYFKATPPLVSEALADVPPELRLHAAIGQHYEAEAAKRKEGKA